jgi:hypothetical protein
MKKPRKIGVEPNKGQAAPHNSPVAVFVPTHVVINVGQHAPQFAPVALQPAR